MIDHSPREAELWNALNASTLFCVEGILMISKEHNTSKEVTLWPMEDDEDDDDDDDDDEDEYSKSNDHVHDGDDGRTSRANRNSRNGVCPTERM